MTTSRQTQIGRAITAEMVPVLRELFPALLVAALDQEREAVAQRVVELLRESGERDDGLIDTNEVARRLGRSQAWVYDHKEEFGVVYLGTGPRPRLGFHPERIAAYLTDLADCSAGSRSPTPSRRTRRRSSNGQGIELLPIQRKAQA